MPESQTDVLNKLAALLAKEQLEREEAERVLAGRKKDREMETLRGQEEQRRLDALTRAKTEVLCCGYPQPARCPRGYKLVKPEH